MALGFFNSSDTPEQLLQRRRELDYLASRMGGAQNVGQGIGDMLSGLAVGIGRSRANKAETAGRESGKVDWGSLLGGAKPQAPQMGGGEPFPNPAALPSQAPQTPPAQEFGGNSGIPASKSIPATALLQKPAQAVPVVGGGKWLNYANQSAIRSKPINTKLEQGLSFLPDMGVSMKVFSGGQDATGPNRTGSHRHDGGGAADAFFYKDGKQLDWRTPKDIPLLQQIVSRAKANGVTGFGAGEGYMQPGSMHIGLGSPAIWGAGGKGENAPEWLRQAYNTPYKPTAGSPQAPVQVASNDPQFTPTSAMPQDVSQETMQPQPQPQQVEQAQPQSGQDLGKLYGILSNPWTSDQDKAIAQQMLAQQLQQQDPMRQLQMQSEQQGITKGQLEIDAMINPKADPMKQLQMQKLQQEIDSGNVIEVGGRLIDSRTRQVVYEPPVKPEFDFINGKDGSVFLGNKTDGSMKTLYGAPPDPVKPTADIQEYEYAVKQAKANGVPQTQIPSFDQWTIQQKKAGASQVNIDQKAEGAFDKKLAEGQAEIFNTMATDGMNARADIGLINQLDGLLQGQGGMGTGLAVAAGKWGLPVTDGMSDLQAADAIISKLVPTQRQPGSGSMSDRDVELFKSSLPSLWNQPGGNATIVKTMRGLAEYKQAQGEIAQAVQMGQISRQDAVKALKNLPNPLAEFGKQKSEQDSGTPPPQDWDAEDWKYLTPEEKKQVLGK